MKRAVTPPAWKSARIVDRCDEDLYAWARQAPRGGWELLLETGVVVALPRVVLGETVRDVLQIELRDHDLASLRRVAAALIHAPREVR